MSTDAAEPTAAKPMTWRLDTDNGSMHPRSALDVLVDLNEKVTTGNVGEYQPVPLGFTPARQDDRHRPARRRAAAHRWRPGHRQDDDGPPDGPKHRVGWPGERPLHLLRARRAVPAQPAHRDGVGAGPPAPQDRRDQDPGCPQGDHGHVDGRWRQRRPAGEQPAPAPVARPDRPVRPEPVPDARLADREHGRQHPQARPAAPSPVGRPAPRRLRGLHAEGPADPGARERDREGHVHRQRPQGHRPGRGRADDQHRRRGQGRA